MGRNAEYCRRYRNTVEEFNKQAMGRVPLGEMVPPEEVADLVAFLLSDAGKNITAQAISICGGSTQAWKEFGLRNSKCGIREHLIPKSAIREFPTSIPVFIHALPHFFPSLPPSHTPPITGTADISPLASCEESSEY